MTDPKDTTNPKSTSQQAVGIDAIVSSCRRYTIQYQSLKMAKWYDYLRSPAKGNFEAAKELLERNREENPDVRYRLIEAEIIERVVDC